VKLNNLNLVRGIFLVAIAAAFGIASLNYSVGNLARTGPGLFPLIVSSMLGTIGVLTIVRSFFVPPVPLDYRVRNIAIIFAALCSFALVSGLLNMVAGIVCLVFIGSFAGAKYSVARNIKICVGLIAVAAAFKYLLGLGLPLL